MALSGKERQQRWRQKQKSKKQVAVLLSQESYAILSDEKEQSGENFSMIIDRALNSNIAQKQEDTVFFENEKRFRDILENSFDMIYRYNIVKEKFDYVSPSSEKVLGYSSKELSRRGKREALFNIHPEDYKSIQKQFDMLRTKDIGDIENTIEYRVKHKEKGYRWIRDTRTVIFNKNKQAVSVVGSVQDITKWKQAEEDLIRLHKDLEMKVKERTVGLKDANTALQVLLEKMDKDRVALERKILMNVKKLILPNLEMLKNNKLTDMQKTSVKILETNLNNIISPLSDSLFSKSLDLTRGEIQIANLIRQGKTSKEIAVLLHRSVRTIEFHRARIRKKLGLEDRRTTLEAYLLTLS